MIGIQQRSDLVTAITDTLFSRSDITSAQTDRWIQLAEVQMQRRISSRLRMGVNQNFVITSEFVNVPSDFAGAIAFELQTVTQLNFSAFTTVPAVNDTLTQATSGASGIVSSVNNVSGAFWVGLISIVGTFDTVGAILDGVSTVGTPTTIQINGNVIRRLDAQTPDQIGALREMHFASSLTGTPFAYSVIGSQFRFFQVPDGAYSSTLTYWQRFAPLVNGADTNWVLAKHPDVYLYGSLMNAGPWLADPNAVEEYGELFQALLNDVIEQDKNEQPGGSLQVTPSNVFGWRNRA